MMLVGRSKFMATIRKNNKGKVLFSSFKAATNAEKIDELNGFTIEIETNTGTRLPREFVIDREGKRIVLKTDHE